MDPYAVLHVRRNAKPETIRKAFRKRSMASHPDRGGTAEEFAQVKLAYEILSGPERRARYDATGDASEQEPDNRASEMAACLVNTFNQVSCLFVSTLRSPGSTDIPAMMRTLLEKALIEAMEKRQEATKGLDVLKDIAGRISEAKGAILATTLAEQQKMIEDGLRSLTRQEATIKAALDYLCGVTYRHTPTDPRRSTGIGDRWTMPAIDIASFLRP